MMNKTEIAAKLKSSIEEKLCSLGAYVDKELPEYILVMIANKKSKESMEKDLQLFLGQNTTNFIDWLQELLLKFHENPDGAFSVDKNKKKDIVTEISAPKSPDKKKKKDKVKSKKTRKSDEKKEGRKSSVVKVHRSRSRSPRGSPASRRHEEESLKKVTPDKSSKKVNVESKTDVTRIEKEQVPEKPLQVLSSIVKVTERPAPKVDIPKQSMIMIQRDIKEADNIVSRKRDPPTQMVPQQSEHRSSVFSRLGKTDLRSSKLSKTNEFESNERRTLKRTIGNSESDDDSDVRYRSKLVKPNDVKLSSTSFLDRDKPSDNVDDSSAWYRQSRTIKGTVLKTVEKDEFMSATESAILPIQTKVVQAKEEKAINIDSDNWTMTAQEKEEKSVSTNFIVTLKGAERLNMSLKSRLGPKKTANDVNLIEDNVDEIKSNVELEDSVVHVPREATNDVVVASQTSRCKFWPKCKNKDSCTFMHPQECNNFPNCKFGSACLYVHPDCRFGSNCTKSDCPFTHHQPKMMSSIMLPTAGLLARCLFYPNCTNVNCKFFHPNLPCKFGLACKSKDTCMFYHPTMPHINELKWVASDHEMKTTAGVHKAELQTA